MTSFNEQKHRFSRIFKTDANEVQSDLQKEVIQLKKSRVELRRQHQMEIKTMKATLKNQAVEIKRLTKYISSLKSEFEKKMAIANHKEATLKIKIDEAKMLNMKLKTAVDQNKKLKILNDPKKVSMESFKRFLDEQISNQIFEYIDTKVSYRRLHDEREALERNMIDYQLQGCPDESMESKLSYAKNELDICKAQIHETLEKLNTFDVKKTIERICDGFTTVKSSNYALEYVLKLLVDTREELIGTSYELESELHAAEYNRRQFEAMKSLEYESQNLKSIRNGMELDLLKKFSDALENSETAEDQHYALVSMSQAFCDQLKENLTLKLKLLRYNVGNNITDIEDLTRPISLSSEDSDTSSSYKSIDLKQFDSDGVRIDLLKVVGKTKSNDDNDEKYDLKFTPYTDLTRNDKPTKRILSMKKMFGIYEDVDKIIIEQPTKHVIEKSCDMKINDPVKEKVFKGFLNYIPTSARMIQKRLSFRHT